MTTSGTVSFNYTRDQIIRMAMRKVGAISSTEVPSAQETTDWADALNAMMKRWMATGIHVWTQTEGILFLQPSQAAYTLGTGSTDNATETYVSLTLTAAVASGGTFIPVVTSAGVNVGDFFGVTLDSGALSWSTVTSLSGTSVTLAAGLSGAASSGVYAFSYTTKMVRPLRISGARRHVFIGNNDTAMIPLSRIDYRNMPNKLNTGTVTQFFYDPKGGANVQGQMNVWPAPVDSRNAVTMTWWRPIQDFSTGANTGDFPQEWIDTVAFNLAKTMALEYDCPPVRYSMIEKQADEMLDLLSGFDREPESLLFGVNMDQTAR